MVETKMTARELIEQRLSVLNADWDLNDYPDDQRPANAAEANVAYCELLSLLKSLPNQKKYVDRLPHSE